MKTTTAAKISLFLFVITFQQRSGFVVGTTQNVVLAETVKCLESPRRCVPVGALVPDENLICVASSSCSSKFHTTVRCQCDHLCLHYGDCCKDAEAYINNPAKEPEIDTSEVCQSSGVYGSGYYMISKCTDTFSDPTIRSLCEQPTTNDEFLNVPVTDMTDNKLFRNAYCAICNGRSFDDMYFWQLIITCIKDEGEDPPGESPTGDGTSVNDDGTSAFDDGTSVFDDGTSAFDDGTSAFDDGTSAFDDGTSAFDDGTSAFDDGTSAFDDGTSAFDDGTSAFDDGTSAFDDGTSAFDDGTSAFDDGTSAFDDGTSAFDDGTSAFDDGTSAFDDGTSAFDDGTSVYDDGTSAFDDGTSVSGNGGSNSDGGIDEGDSEQFRIINNNLKMSSCSKKYLYRLENSNPYRKCTPIQAPVLVDSGHPQISCPLYVAPYLSGNITYRNRECALCDEADISGAPCDYPVEIIDPQNVPTFNNLFLFKNGYQLSERSPVRPSPCNEDEMFDPFSNVCRRVVARYEPQVVASRDDNHTQFAVSGKTFVKDVGEVCLESDTESCTAIKEKIASAMSMLIQAEISYFEGQVNIDQITCVESDDEVVFCSEEVPSSSTLCSFSGAILTNTTGVLTSLEQRSSGPLAQENYRSLSCQTEPLMNIQAFTLTPGVVACSNISTDANTSSIRFSWNNGRQQTHIWSGYGRCLDGIVATTCESGYVHYGVSSVLAFNDTHIFLNETGQTFAPDTYYKTKDGFWICEDDLRDQCDIKDEAETVEMILTIVGHTLSLIGLTATILTYVVLSRLRNNMGKSILSLVSALFVGQLFQFALWNKTSNPSFCTAVAMITHYSFLAAFFWMSVLGYDLSRTFGNRSKMQTVRDSKKTFFYFSLYAWCGPLVIVGVSAVFHFGNFEDVTFRYGNVCICWIHDGNALLVAFGAPVITLLALNFFFFADTVIGILRARIATKRATSSNSNLLNRDGKQDFLLFCKLSSIMGLTWVVSFTAGFIDSTPLGIISIVLNSTQGLLIYIAFGCNSRVIEMWRNNYSKRSHTSSRANSLAVTAKTSVSSMTGQQVNQVRIPRGNLAAVPKQPLV